MWGEGLWEREVLRRELPATYLPQSWLQIDDGFTWTDPRFQVQSLEALSFISLVSKGSGNGIILDPYWSFYISQYKYVIYCHRATFLERWENRLHHHIELDLNSGINTHSL